MNPGTLAAISTVVGGMSLKWKEMPVEQVPHLETLLLPKAFLETREGKFDPRCESSVSTYDSLRHGNSLPFSGRQDKLVEVSEVKSLEDSPSSNVALAAPTYPWLGSGFTFSRDDLIYPAIFTSGSPVASAAQSIPLDDNQHLSHMNDIYRDLYHHEITDPHQDDGRMNATGQWPEETPEVGEPVGDRENSLSALFNISGFQGGTRRNVRRLVDTGRLNKKLLASAGMSRPTEIFEAAPL
ncbi:hypothetical protein DL766_010276 [Monosporascus sp. MC13-8B]|uniref:Uncharacterized protein n=1 Tax=Monosporascus cannonballus TaxID=155416 RepID=A0ABY0GTB9_9PEZI|nr:hypothetical protein DL763_010268 [Monosporascus cannonballus]RYO76965.1 hypothetical protein DL762_009568 [Monosporascus cannonballus]RYP01871.1 hypothetical protein DL766_010276 [Monosporascus sp. MC13-8B]